MKRRGIFLLKVAAAAFTLAAGTLSASAAAADVSIRFSTGFSGHAHHHRPRFSHGVPFIKRKYLYGRHHHHPHHRPLYRHRHPGRRARHALGAGCSPATQRYRDQHGRLVIHPVTVCHDRFGRPYVLGGAP